MKKITLLSISVCLFLALNVFGQDETAEGYKFTPISEVGATSVKNQSSSGTCWSFSTIALFESELIRMGKPAVDLSPMFVARMTYHNKAQRYVRFHGSISFSGGGASGDVTDVIRSYGIVPMDVYQGLNYGTDSHQHDELDEVTKAYVDEVVKNPNRKLSTAWLNGFDAILDAYFGKVPESFVYEGKEYSPKSFVQYLGLNVDDYVEISSFSHHPFYEKFIIEVPDNWAHGEVYNVPLDEFGQIVDYAVDNGYPISWGSDVSEPGFSWSNGIAIVPDIEDEELAGSDMAKWTKMSVREKNAKAFDKPGKEMVITQELRQKGFDSYETTDDHGMLIVGKARDQNGAIYYKVKNSWGESGRYNGYFYASKPFVLYKSMTIMLHKNAVPKDIKKKLGIK